MLVSPLLLGIFDRFPAGCDEVTDGLPDGSTDESVDVQTERSFPRFLCFGKFCTGILIGIITMSSADHRTDGTDDRHTDGQMESQVESHFDWQTDESFKWHMDGLVIFMV